MRDLIPTISSLSAPFGVAFGVLVTWLRMRRRDAADAVKVQAEAQKVQAETQASDAEVGRMLREELRAEIAKLRAEQERRDAECERRLKAMEAAQDDSSRVIMANGRTIAKQAQMIERLKAQVADLMAERKAA
jgi:hypothetical protein